MNLDLETRVKPATYAPMSIGLVTLSHTFNDLFATTLSPMLPVLVDKLDMSLTMAGLIGAVFTIVSVTQPLFGYISDRWLGRLFLFIGPLMVAVGMGGAGLAPNYGVLMFLVIFAGIGSAMYHPTGAAMAGVVSGNRKGLGMSLFMAGGSLGRGSGPLVIVFILTTLGLSKTWVLIVPCILLLLGVRLVPAARPSAAELDLSTARQAFSDQAHPLFVLWCIIAIRVVGETGFVTFMPLYLSAQGESLRYAGMAVSVFLLSGIVGTLVGGSIAERIGARQTIIYSAIIAVFGMYIGLHAPGLISLAALSVAGLCMMVAHPINLVMAQELVPKHASTVSGFMMGVAFAVGGIMVAVIGWVADQVGLGLTLNAVAAVMFFSVPFARMLPDLSTEALVTGEEH